MSSEKNRMGTTPKKTTKHLIRPEATDTRQYHSSSRLVAPVLAMRWITEGNANWLSEIVTLLAAKDGPPTD